MSKQVPVEVTIVVFVKEDEWREEHSAEDSDLEECVRDWFFDEILAHIESGEWANVTGVAKRG